MTPCLMEFKTGKQRFFFNDFVLLLKGPLKKFFILGIVYCARVGDMPKELQCQRQFLFDVALDWEDTIMVVSIGATGTAIFFG